MSLLSVILLCAFFGAVLLFCAALCRIGSKADERQEQIMDDWNKIAQEKREQISHQLWRQN